MMSPGTSAPAVMTPGVAPSAPSTPTSSTPLGLRSPDKPASGRGPTSSRDGVQPVNYRPTLAELAGGK
jgi:hypothetical protein